MELDIIIDIIIHSIDDVCKNCIVQPICKTRCLKLNTSYIKTKQQIDNIISTYYTINLPKYFFYWELVEIIRSQDIDLRKRLLKSFFKLVLIGTHNDL